MFALHPNNRRNKKERNTVDIIEYYNCSQNSSCNNRQHMMLYYAYVCVPIEP